jgi:hypothetical protein
MYVLNCLNNKNTIVDIVNEGRKEEVGGRKKSRGKVKKCFEVEREASFVLCNLCNELVCM